MFFLQKDRSTPESRSEDDAKTPAILMSLLRSAELQGINPVENLLASTKNVLTVKTSTGLAYKPLVNFQRTKVSRNFFYPL